MRGEDDASVSQPIRILTDSVADLWPDLARRLDIAVAPIYVSLNGKSYLDDGSLSRRWFYTALQQEDGLPQTAAPSVDDLLTVYKTLIAEGAEEIVALFMASRLSSMHAQARRAARLARGARVHLIDTQQVSMGIGWLAVAAAEAVQTGASVAEVRELIEDLKRRTFVVGMLDTLEYLRRGGRVSWVQAQMGSLLRLKPLIGFHRSEARLLGQARTRRRALRWLLDWLSEVAPVERLALLHTGFPDVQLERLRTQLNSFVPQEEVLVVEAGPVFCTHVGPKAVGVAVVQEKTAPAAPWPTQ